jgi:uncharacterized membrane protein
VGRYLGRRLWAGGGPRSGERLEAATCVVEVVGIGPLTAGIAIATVLFVCGLAAATPFVQVYELYRRRLGQAILLGLEPLVAADIIETVTIGTGMARVAVLAVMVLIRTFLSMSLSVEIEGRWPWQRAAAGEPERLT